MRQWPEASGGAAAVLAAGEVPEAPSLVRKAKAGDLEAFEQLMILHQRKVYAVALRLLGERADAQDAAQEVFVRLYRHLGRFDERRPLEPWLYRMTVNACRDIGRRRRVFEPLDTLRASGADPHAEASRGEQSRLLAAAIRRLPHKERAALVLRDLEGLSAAEVGRILGSSEGTVRSQVSAARLKLRALLGGRR